METPSPCPAPPPHGPSGHIAAAGTARSMSFSPQKEPGVFKRARGPAQISLMYSGWGSLPPHPGSTPTGTGGGAFRPPLQCPIPTLQSSAPHPPWSGRPLNAQMQTSSGVSGPDPSVLPGPALSPQAPAGPWPAPSGLQVPASLRPPPPASAPSCLCRRGTHADTAASGAPAPRRSLSGPALPWPRGRHALPGC